MNNTPYCLECNDNIDANCSECCEHVEHDHGICLDCGGEVDWVSRVFVDND